MPKGHAAVGTARRAKLGARAGGRLPRGRQVLRRLGAGVALSGLTTCPGQLAAQSPEMVLQAPSPSSPATGAPPVEGSVAPASRAGSVRYVLEAIEVRGNVKTRRGVVEAQIPFRPGDLLDVDDLRLKLVRYRLLGTGLFREAQIALRKGSRRGRVVMVVEVTERNTIVITDLAMGVSADADTDGDRRPLAAFMGIAGAERNLAGTGITLGTAMALSQGGAPGSEVDQVALRVSFFDPSFLRTRWTLAGELLYNDAIDFFGNSGVVADDPRPGSPAYAVLEYKRFGGRVDVGAPLSLASRFRLGYRLETVSDVRAPRAAAHNYGGRVEPIDFHVLPGNSVLSTLGGTVEYDTRDHPLLPTRGWLASASLEMSLAPVGSDYAFGRIDLRAQHWMRLALDHVFSIDLFAGAIAGDAPLFEQYYVGDFTDFQPGRLLGLNFDRRPSPNFLGTAIEEVRHAQYALSLTGEYRIPLFRGRRSVFAIDFFASAGAFLLATQQELNRPLPRFEGLSRVPMDLTGNLGFRLDTSLGGFTFAFSNVLGFLPVRRGEER